MNFWQDLPRPFFILAPMEAVTDVVFRHVIAHAARPDIFFTEFTNASSYASEKGIHSTRGRLTFTPDEHPMVAQIWGSRPDQFAYMARGLADMGYKGIDINMGCPDKSVVKGGAGSALIRTPELASELIAAAKEGGLPVSVKTRLGFSSTDEWREWLTHLLKQDIANLTIHLRTRKEMSKVDAHFELIPDIKKLRDEIAPQTLLTINGDIRDRQHGQELVDEYGVDGIMIGRGIFHNPFAFEAPSRSPAPPIPPQGHSTGSIASPWRSARPDGDIPSERREELARQGQSDVTTPARVTRGGAAPLSSRSETKGRTERQDPRPATYVELPVGSSDNGSNHHKEKLIALLRLHLDLFDKYSAELEPRRFEPLKRFFKIYIRDFPGASELREKLMHTKTTDEVRALIGS
jgi:tRNA-dihydrouridine synthase